jgi:1A family penicillin-binding protein
MKLGGILKTKLSFFSWKDFKKLPKKEKRKRILRTIGWIALFFVALILWYSKDLPTPAKLAKIRAAESTKILDRSGNVLYETGDERRTIIEKEDMPANIKNATIAAEDANFYRHQGVDLKGIARAVVSDILSLDRGQGGSTITQQFVKNAVLSSEKSFTRKFKELILSIELEQIYSKEEILTMYLNEIPYGGNIYGVQEASRVYFGKEAKDLSLAESATLASIPKASTYYSPYGTHTDMLFMRKDYILDRMSSLGYITKEEAEKAKDESPSKDKPEFKERRDSIKAPHFVMYVKEKLAEQYGEKLVDSGGLKVTTTLDSEKQTWAEEAIHSNESILERYGATNAALVSVDTKTGEIVSMVGGKDYFDIENQGNVNVADSSRQPGSSFKPIVYATALKQPRFSPSFNLFDLTTDFSGYIPNNYDGTTHGPVTMRTALSNSLNIPAVKTLALVGVPEALKTAKDLGITTLNQPERYGLSLVLGGGEVKPIEMAGAFAAFSDAGTYHKPIAILKVEDHKGKILYEHKAETNKFKAIDPQIAYQISHMLDDDEARQMVFGFQNKLNFGDAHVAVKTGTTQEFHDAWTVGYSPKYATAVWVGNNNNEKMRSGADGSVLAAPIFHDFMIKLVDSDDFQRPAGIQEITVEKYSNLLPSQYSKDFVTDIFASWQVPTKNDDINIIFKVNKTNNKIATDSTPPELIEEKLFANIHNEWGDAWNKYLNWEGPVRSWAEGNDLLLPPTEQDDSYSYKPEVKITSPNNNATLSSNTTVQVSTKSQQPIKNVSYYLNDSEIGTSSNHPYGITLDTTKYSNATYTLRARLTDSNSVTAEYSINVIISNDLDPKISNVAVSSITANSAKITFSTSQSADSKLSYGTSQSKLDKTINCSSSTKSHSCSLPALASLTKYFYKITATHSSGASAEFQSSFTTN